MPPATFVFLDVASTVLTAVVAVAFLLLARVTRESLHVQVAAGFALIAGSFLFVAAGHFAGGTQGDLADALRMLGQLLGALTLLLAYATHHGARRPHPLVVAVGAVGATAGVGLLLWVIPPLGIPPLPGYFATTYALVALAFLGCALLSGYGWHRRPTWGRAMVPLAFLAWTTSSYTWIFITLGAGDAFLPVVYAWRLLAIVLLLWALARRPRLPPRWPNAPA